MIEQKSDQSDSMVMPAGWTLSTYIIIILRQYSKSCKFVADGDGILLF